MAPTKEPVERVIVKLERPVTAGSETVREIAIRPCFAEDMDDLPMEPKMGDMRRLLGRLSGQPDHITAKMNPSDLTRCFEVVGNFLQPGPATGASSSGS